MASRKSSRSSAKKPAKYVDDDDDDEAFDDDDFTMPTVSRQAKKAKTSKETTKSAEIDKPNRTTTKCVKVERPALDEKLFERDLQLALEMSKQTSSSSSEEPNVCMSASRTSPTNLTCAETDTQHEKTLTKLCQEKETETGQEKMQDCQSPNSSEVSHVTKTIGTGNDGVDDDDDDGDDYQSESEQDDDDDDYDDDSDNDFGSRKKAKSKPMSKKSKLDKDNVKSISANSCKKAVTVAAAKKTTSSSAGGQRTKGKTISSSTARNTSVGSIALSNPKGSSFCSPVTSSTTNRSFTSPSSGLRLGLSRKAIVKSLHGPPRTVNS